MMFFREDLTSIQCYIPDSDIPVKPLVPSRRDRKLEVKKRAVGKFKEYALCNEWIASVTFTISPRSLGFSRGSDIQKAHHWFLDKLQEYKRTVQPEFKYLVVPEMKNVDHLHYHGLIYDSIDEKATWTDKDGITRKLWTRHTEYDCKRKQYYSVYINQWFLHNVGLVQMRVIGSDITRDSAVRGAIDYAVKYATKMRDYNPLPRTYYCSNGLNGYVRWKSDSPVIQAIVESYYNYKFRTQYGMLYYIDKSVFYDHFKRCNSNDLIPLVGRPDIYDVQEELDLSYMRSNNSSLGSICRGTAQESKDSHLIEYSCVVSVNSKGERCYSYAEKPAITQSNDSVFCNGSISPGLESSTSLMRLSSESAIYRNAYESAHKRLIELSQDNEPLDSWEKIIENAKSP